MLRAALEDAERACAAYDCERAIRLFEAAIVLQPHDFRLHYRLGQCYGGDCHTHPQVHPEMAIAYLRQARRLLGAAPPAIRAAVAEQLGNAWCHTGSAAALRDAIECHAECAELYRSLGMSDDWARAQFNLGNSYCDLSELTGEDHWQEAVARYRECLRVRTREEDPERHAAVLENLGSAYRRLAGGANVKRSLQCYRQALRIYTKPVHAGKRSAIENNMGNAYLSLPAADDAVKSRNAARALRHFDRALFVQSRDRKSRAYGITQYNRAQAYSRLKSTAAIAKTCLEEAFTIFQSCGETRYTELVRTQLSHLCTGSL